MSTSALPRPAIAESPPPVPLETGIEKVDDLAERNQTLLETGSHYQTFAHRLDKWAVNIHARGPQGPAQRRFAVAPANR